MDIGSFSDAYAKANEEGREVSLKNPDTGNPVGIKIKIAGPYSKRQEDAQRDYSDWSREHPNATQAEGETALMRRFARGVISWQWAEGMTFRGSVPECTMDNLVKVFADCRWFYDQTVSETHVSRGFIKG